MYTINAVASLLIILPVAAGWIRYRHIQPASNPFIWWLSLGLVNELISLWANSALGTNAVNSNIFKLVSTIMILYQLHRWNPAVFRISLVYGTAMLFLLLFMGEWAFRGSLFVFFSYQAILSALLIVFVTGYFLSKRIPDAVDWLYHDAITLICMGWLIVYTSAISTQFFIFYAGPSVTAVYVPLAFSAVNLLCNLLFLYAILCLPLNIRSFLRRC